MAHHLGAEHTAVWRYESDASAVLVIVNGDADARLPVGSNVTLDGENLLAIVRHSRRPARQDNLAIDNGTGATVARVREIGIRTAVGVPIIVEHRVWGAAVVGSTKPDPLPPDTEARLGDFADLVAIALANAATRDELQTSRDQLHELAERQAALRRVATLVARGVDPAELFHAVAEEIVRCLHVDIGTVWRYNPDGSVVLMAKCHPPGQPFTAVGQRLTLAGDSAAALVWRSGAAARIDSFDDAVGEIAAKARAAGVRSAVGVPVVVDGSLWGLAAAASYRFEPPPPDSEERISDFADLVSTALANAATREELIASRARIVAAADDARRRLERDLHDGAQQRLVSLALQLRLAEGSAPQDLKAQLSRAVVGLKAVSNELQQISRGIHPAILSKGGLGPALKMIARRCPVPVSLDVDVERRLPESLEVAAFYVVAEALTNTAKYAQASAVHICVETKGGNLLLSIEDDGIGGADIQKGSGLIGLKDRVEVLGGHMRIASRPGDGTALLITIPVGDTVG
jgi:signal transduction histidine kinase